jgi:hypothetical protein
MSGPAGRQTRSGRPTGPANHDDGGLAAAGALVDVVGHDGLQLVVAGQAALDEVHAAVVAGGHVDQTGLAVDALADQEALAARGGVARELGARAGAALGGAGREVVPFAVELRGGGRVISERPRA